jgi:peptidoglycan/xylan/chitin deacetylase (PgdA/CDA1 family)
MPGTHIVAHSYAMDVIPIYLDEDEERANIRRTVDLIVRATGKRPTGWISPRGTPSLRTGRLLAEEGFEGTATALNDDLPYFVHFKAGTVVSFSSKYGMQRSPALYAHGNPPRVMLEIFPDWLDYARKYEQAPPASTRRFIPTSSVGQSECPYSSA